MRIALSYGTFEVCPADLAVNRPTVTEGFWDPVLKPCLDQVPEGSLVLDIGAHVGFYSAYLARVRHCRVIAYEGNPRYWPLLASNVARLSVLVQPFFLYSRRCQLVEHTEHATPASNTWLPHRWQGVPAYPLDYWLPTIRAAEKARRTPLAFMKIDAQGADLQILKGAKRTIARYHPTLLVEYEPALALQHGDSGQDYEQWSEDHGYVPEAIAGRDLYLTWTGRQ
jgi:FkbM family methyltransferase